MPDNTRANLEVFGHSNLEARIVAKKHRESVGKRRTDCATVLGVKVCDLWFDVSNTFGAAFCARGVFSSIQVCWAEDSCPTTSGLRKHRSVPCTARQAPGSVEAGKCGAVEVHVSGHIILLRANTRCFVEARQRGACDRGLVADD